MLTRHTLYEGALATAAFATAAAVLCLATYFLALHQGYDASRLGSVMLFTAISAGIGCVASIIVLVVAPTIDD